MIRGGLTPQLAASVLWSEEQDWLNSRQRQCCDPRRRIDSTAGSVNVVIRGGGLTQQRAALLLSSTKDWFILVYFIYNMSVFWYCLILLFCFFIILFNFENFFLFLTSLFTEIVGYFGFIFDVQKRALIVWPEWLVCRTLQRVWKAKEKTNHKARRRLPRQSRPSRGN